MDRCYMQLLRYLFIQENLSLHYSLYQENMISVLENCLDHEQCFILFWIEKKYHLADTLCIWMQALFSDVISFFNKLQILIDFHVQMFWMLNSMKFCIYIFISQTYYCFWIAFYFWILRSSKSFNVIMYVGRFNQDGNLNHISFWTLYICSDW